MRETLYDNYRLCEVIGRGRYGTVSRCFSLSASSEVSFACKVIDKSLLTDPLDRECLQNEPKLMTLLSPHSNIVRIHDVYENDAVLSIVMELCGDPHPFTLYDEIVERNPVGETTAAGYMKQLLSALAHCHRYGVVHRDVKPDNVFLTGGGGLKLGDFGSAEWLGTATGVVGTPYYVAPEVVMGREYDEKVDVWSAGVVLYTMLAGTPPFYGETAEEIFEAVERGNLRFPTRIFLSVSPAAKDLMRKMISRDVSRRLSAEQALKHPWISSGGETASMEQ